MADFYQMMTNQEIENQVSFLLEQGAQIIPACHYDEASYVRVSSLQEFLYYFVETETKLYHIVHDSWDSEPLEMGFFENDEGIKKYFVAQKEGGPDIQFFTTGEFSSDGKQFVGTGFLSYYGKYRSPSLGENIKAPEELKKFYKIIASEFKKNAISLKGATRNYWVKKETNDRIQAGELNIYIQF